MISLINGNLFKSIDIFVLITFILTFVIGCQLPSEPEPPAAITITGVEEVTSSSLKLVWTQSTDSDFSKYVIYRSTSSSVSENSTLVTTIYSKGQISYTVTGLSVNTTYYFKIYVYNGDDLSAGSNTLSATTAELLEIEDYTTNYQGKSAFEIGGYDVVVETKDENDIPISGVELRASITPNYLIIVSGSSSYYPVYHFEPLGAYRKEANALGKTSFDPITIYLVYKAVTLGYAVYDFLSESHFQDVLDEDGVTKRCLTGDVNDLFDILSVLDVLGIGGGIVQLSNQAASTLGTSVLGLSFMNEILGDPDLFGVSLADGLNILDQDIAIYCWGEDESGFVFTPIYVESVELHREFEYKFTLTWGENPRDLDSHLWTPSIDGYTHHIYFNNQGSTDTEPYAELDVDDIRSYGPENITIKELFSGTYYYSIHHYDIWSDDAGLITTSGATVKILGPQGELYTMNVPSGSAESGWWWNVLQINGTTGQISKINQISSSPPSGTLLKAVDRKVAEE